MSKVIVFMADGMEMCECLLTVDILRRAGLDVTTASVMGRKEITSSHRVTILADETAEDVDFDAADMIILPGGRIGTEHLAESKTVADACRKFAECDGSDGGRVRHVAAICAAPSVLAGLGLLDNKLATCHPEFEEKMGEALLTRKAVTVTDNIITGQGLGSTFEFAFEIVKILAGEEIADNIKAGICYRD